VRLAARGSRNLDDGEVAIDDLNVVRQLRRRGRKVMLESGVAAVLLAVLGALIL